MHYEATTRAYLMITLSSTPWPILQRAKDLLMLLGYSFHQGNHDDASCCSRSFT